MSHFRLNHYQGRNENAPAGTGANCSFITVARVCEWEGPSPFYRAPEDRTRGVCLMTRGYSRTRPEGRHHRDKIQRWIIPKLEVGCRVPSANWMARFLGISSSEGGRQIRRALDEAGITTETRGVGRGRRIYVVTLGERP